MTLYISCAPIRRKSGAVVNVVGLAGPDAALSRSRPIML